MPDFIGGLLPVGAFAGPIEVTDLDTGDPISVETHLGHECTEQEIREAFVERFTQTQTRHAIFYEVMQHIRLAGETLPCAAFLLSGGFVADLDDPEDAHLVVIAAGDDIKGLSAFEHWKVERTFADREVRFGSDQRLTTQLVTLYPHGHSRWEVTLMDLAVARHFCGNPLQDDHEGGYLQLLQCEGGGHDASLITLLAGAAPST